MPPSKPITLRLSHEMQQALDAHCSDAGVSVSEAIRMAICAHIGRPDLAGTMPAEGRPKKLTEEAPPKRAKKAKR